MTTEAQLLSGVRDASSHLAKTHRQTLELLGDRIARKHDYRATELEGVQAVRFYLMQKHGWLPRDVRDMSDEDLLFATAEECAAILG